ncbi:MAG: magnesium and cobalt transport protein CorA [Stackebrandtia sp.]
MTPTAMTCRPGRFEESVTGPAALETAIRDAAQSSDGFMWIDLSSPSREEFDTIARQLGLDGTDYDELIRHRPRHAVDWSGDVRVFAFKALTRRKNGTEANLTTTQIVLCVTGNLVLTIHDGADELFAEVRHNIHTDASCLENGPFSIAHVVCDEVIAEYDRIAHGIESDIIEVEHEVFDSESPDPLDEIYALKREVLFFRRVEDPLHPVLNDLARGRVDIGKGARERFQQCLHDLDRVDTTIDSLNELITGILQAHLAQVAVQQNTDMRRISSWAAMIAVPTMIAGVYGMNFKFMPELNWVFGYPLAVVAMLVACYFVYRRLKKSGWL